MRVLLIALGGSAGAACRYGIASAIGPSRFPWSTLTINVAGSFVLGLVLAASAARQWSPGVTAALAIGFLGAFTTFSTFSAETLALERSGELAQAALYAAGSVLLGVVAAYCGTRLGRGISG